MYVFTGLADCCSPSIYLSIRLSMYLSSLVSLIVVLLLERTWHQLKRTFFGWDINYICTWNWIVHEKESSFVLSPFNVLVADDCYTITINMWVCISLPFHGLVTCCCSHWLLSVGWEGPAGNCRTMTDLCVSSPCQNGATCSPLLNDFSCQCAVGFTGRLGLSLMFCIDDVCSCV